MNVLQQIQSVEKLPDGRIAIDPAQWDLLPKTPFDRVYLDKFNSLNCKPDLEIVCHFNAKHITNVMAAWMAYKRNFGVFKAHTNDTSFVVYAPNKRMAAFLRHMTKWDVYSEKLPNKVFFYFGINPDRREFEDVSGANVVNAVIVGGNPFITEGYFELTTDYYDERILGPNKLVMTT